MLVHDQLARFFSLRRIAVLGVSTWRLDPTRFVFRALRAAGHDVLPIRAGVPEIDGVRAFARVADLTGLIDGAVIMTTRRLRDPLIEDCVDAGILRIWLVAPHAATADSIEVIESYGLEVVATTSALPYLERPARIRTMRWLGGRDAH